MTLEVEREEAVQALCAHYAQDHLTTGELEHRFERVYGASTAVELRTVFEGLPALRQLPAVAGAPLYAIAPPSAAPARPERRYLALFSGVK